MEDLLKEVERGKKADLKNLKISQITELYLEKVKKGKDVDLDEACDFLASAAELLRNKSLQLLEDYKENLSEEENEEENFEEKIFEEEASFLEKAEVKLKEYRTFKEAANFLRMRLMSGEKYYPRPELSNYVNTVNSNGFLEGLNLEDLISAFEKVLLRHKGAEEKENGEFFEIEEQEYKITDKINELIKFLNNFPSGIEFYSLFGRETSKREIIVTFLALLELVRLQKARVKQETQFGKIIIYPILNRRKG
ncbi:MAG TPA: hypothetical protein DEA47_03870 [Peptococcaceae bacterium]|nr:MAG: Segregation and condensation protein A [Clostridia bacterium 41_269]HBT20489.1 hypothetical protein [Peptococcaceae bacterium]